MSDPTTVTAARGPRIESDLILDEHSPEARVDRNVQLYEGLGYAVRNQRMTRERAAAALYQLDRSSEAARGNLSASGSGLRVQRLTEASSAAHAEFDRAWPPEAHSAAGVQRARPSRRQVRGRMQRRMRAVVHNLQGGMSVGASLAALSQGVRGRQLVEFMASASESEVSGMATRAGATSEQARDLVAALEVNAATAFHGMVRDETIAGLDRVSRSIEHLRQPAQSIALARRMLHDPLVGRAVFQSLVLGEIGERVKTLLWRYDTTPSSNARHAMEGELGEAVAAALEKAGERVAEFRQEVLNGSLGTPLDTQLYRLVPGAVTRAAQRLGFARSQGRTMVDGYATGISLLEAGVAAHTGEVQDEQELAENIEFGASIAFGLFATAATGGAAAAVVAGLLRTGMLAAGRYAADSAALEQAQAAASAGLATEADVEHAEVRRNVHLVAAVADAGAEVGASVALRGVENAASELVEAAAGSSAGRATQYAAEHLAEGSAERHAQTE